jgi:hypothetical protein
MFATTNAHFVGRGHCSVVFLSSRTVGLTGKQPSQSRYVFNAYGNSGVIVVVLTLFGCEKKKK